MSIGPTTTAAAMAGVPLAQTKGSTPERAEQQLGAAERRVYYGRKAETAADVGQPDGEDHETTERDADGRYPWEGPPETGKKAAPHAPHPSKDPSQQRGNLLDLTG